jgi:hypothetical protein
MNVHWRNSTIKSEEKSEEKFDAAYGTTKPESSFKEASRSLKLYIFFFLISQTKGLKTISACSRSTGLIQWTCKKNIHLVTL